MQIIEYLLKGFEFGLFGYFAMSCLYISVFAVAGHFYKKRQTAYNLPQNRIAVLIPAYKEDTVIVEVSKSALHHHYPSNKFDVVVIADTLKKDTVMELKSLPIIVIEASFEKSTKAKALNRAMSTLENNYDYAVILDADNIMEGSFLEKMNAAFESGFQIVQGHRKAKNRNTSFAILDAASEEVNNHIFRKGHSALGLSAGLIGSGMGFEYNMFKSMLKTVNAIGGFDKELEFKFAEKGIAIEYLQDAVVLDEKIQKSSDFSNQRKRWLSTQFVYLNKYFRKGWKELLLNGNINFFDKVFQMMIPPRILLLGTTVLITSAYGIIVFGFNFQPNVSVYFWLTNLVIIVLTFLLALPKSFYNINTLKALVDLPSAFLTMALLLFKLKGANKKFIHTTHGTI
jgi:cellulose synthase/poly-beta-1,6-N-acetylglucosamine synthase-like glycosyltransferase